jgi:hypothetical protein
MYVVHQAHPLTSARTHDKVQVRSLALSQGIEEALQKCSSQSLCWCQLKHSQRSMMEVALF